MWWVTWKSTKNWLNTSILSPPPLPCLEVFFSRSFQGGSSVGVLCLCVGGFIWLSFVIVAFSGYLHLHFDALPQNLPKYKLHAYDIKEKILKWINSIWLLTLDSTQCVVVNDVKPNRSLSCYRYRSPVVLSVYEPQRQETYSRTCLPKEDQISLRIPSVQSESILGAFWQCCWFLLIPSAPWGLKVVTRYTRSTFQTFE